MHPETAPSPTATDEAREDDRPRFPVWVRVLLTVPLAFLSYTFLLPVALLPGTDAWVLASPVNDLIYRVGAALATAAGAVFFLWLATRFLQRCRLRDIGLRWSHASAGLFALGVLIGIIVEVVAALGLDGLGLVPPAAPDASTGPVWMSVVSGLAAGFVMQAFPEEFFYRGWLMRVLARRPMIAIITSTLLFGAIHALSMGDRGPGENLVYMFQAAAFGFTGACLAVRLRSVWPAVGVHGGMHAGLLVPPFFGVGEGVWTWGVSGILFVLVGLAVLLRGPLPDRVVLDR